MARIDDFREQLVSLLTPGDLLATDRDSGIGKLLHVFAKEIERLEAAAESVLREFDHRSTTTFLNDYEEELGLPECGVDSGTTQQRRARIVAKLDPDRSLSLSYIDAFLDSAGFTATVTDPGTTDHQFEVDVPSLPFVLFRAGSSKAGDKLGENVGSSELTCILDRIKPAWSTYILTAP